MRLIFFVVVFLGSLVFFALTMRRKILYMRMGTADDRTDHIGARILRTLRVAIGQSKLFREFGPGLMHALIFWGFLVLLTAVGEAIVEGLVPSFRLANAIPDSLFSVVAFSQDAFGAGVVLAVIWALMRRAFFTPKRLEVDLHGKADAVAILLTILFVMLTMFGQNAARLSLEQGTLAGERFLSVVLSPVFDDLAHEQREMWFDGFWWAHIVLVLAFLIRIVLSAHLFSWVLQESVKLFLQKPCREFSLR